MTPMPDTDDTPVDATPPETKKAAIGMMRDLRRIRTAITENETAAQADIDEHATKVRDWCETENEPLHARAVNLETALRLWLTARIHDDPRRAKTETLPDGTLSLTKGSLIYDIVDETVAFPLIEAAFPEAINRPAPKPAPAPSIDKRVLAKLVKEKVLRIDGNPDLPGEYKLLADTDEPVDGIVAVRHQETFTVDLT